jgi:UDP-N-acetylmuramate dehydrogenase
MSVLNAGRGHVGRFDSFAKPLRLADLTTVGVGGEVTRFIEPKTVQEFVDAVCDADDRGLPLLVIGGGSNLLVSDEPFEGIVVRDARSEITMLDQGSAAFGGARTVRDANEIDGPGTAGGIAMPSGEVKPAEAVLLRADAGVNWDDFVAYCVNNDFAGIEGLSGVPGTVGASVVQNIGAYGQEVAQCVRSVQAWDRQTRHMVDLAHDDLRFGYRASALKSSMYEATGAPDGRFFPTPRYVVVSVTLALRRSADGIVAMGQLAKALGVEVGSSRPLGAIRKAVLRVRADKGMLEDPLRYDGVAMQGARQARNVAAAVREQVVQASRGSLTEDGHDESDWDDVNRHSCGSFFMNPILSPAEASALPAGAPRFDVTLPDGTTGVKTSAAWLIDHAGFQKGFMVRPGAPAGLSTAHTLALTNRGGAKASDIAELARVVQRGVERAFGVKLVPEPVVVGMDLSPRD